MLATLGGRWRSAEAQLGYLLGELRELALWQPVCGATDAGTAAATFMLRFERPNHRNTGRRAYRARVIYGEALRAR